jgi:hypothetical protein
MTWSCASAPYLRDLRVAAFEQWLIDAAAADLTPFARLAAGMTNDLVAIGSAFRYPWSTGLLSLAQTEPALHARAGLAYQALTGLAGEPTSTMARVTLARAASQPFLNAR